MVYLRHRHPNLELNRSEKPNTLKCTAAAFLVGNGSLTVINVAAVLTRSIVGFALSASQTWLGIPMLVGRQAQRASSLRTFETLVGSSRGLNNTAHNEPHLLAIDRPYLSSNDQSIKLVSFHFGDRFFFVDLPLARIVDQPAYPKRVQGKTGVKYY